MRFVLFYLLHHRLPKESPELDRCFNSKLPSKPGDWAKKSHAQFEALKPHLAPADKIIYVYRHPLDVLQSAYNYSRLNGTVGEGEVQRRAWIDRYIENGGEPDWASSPFLSGKWAENIKSWMTQSEFDVCKLSYEASKNSPAQSVTRLADFLDLSVDHQDVEQCVSATSFESLRTFENREIQAAEKLGSPQGRFSHRDRLKNLDRGIRFFNRGQSGSFKEFLDEHHISRAWEEFGPNAEEIGYTLDV